MQKLAVEIVICVIIFEYYDGADYDEDLCG